MVLAEQIALTALNFAAFFAGTVFLGHGTQELDKRYPESPIYGLITEYGLNHILDPYMI